MRLTYTDDPPKMATPADQAWVEKLVKQRGKLGLGPLYRSLLISPNFARGFLQFFGVIRYQSSLPADVMELAMCRVGALNGAAFEWMHHAPLLLQAGVTEEGVETVRTAKANHVPNGAEGGLSERLWKVMRYADAMTKDVTVSDEVFNAVKEELRDEKQVVELSKTSVQNLHQTLTQLPALTICGYNAVSRFLRAVDVAEMKDVPVGQAKL
jgi:alkylhydroperoxidase family enzyme